MAGRQYLQGTVEEQADQLYDMAIEALQEGRYAGAVRYLAEIERALPGYRDVPELLDKARRARREQRTLLLSSLAGGIVLIIVARLLGAQREWVLFASAVLGLALGFVVALLVSRSVSGDG